MKNLLVWLTALVFLSSCGMGGGGGRHSMNRTDRLPPVQKKHVQDIDKQQKKLLSRIYKNYEKEDKLIERRRNAPSYHESEKAFEELIVTRERNERLKKRYDELDSKKAAILKQGSASCFPGDTFIQTDEGRLKPIMEVKPGEMIMAFDIGTQTNVPRKVIETYKDKNNHYYLINGAIKATAYERFLTTRGWTKVINLKKGDMIQTNQGLEIIDNLIIKNGILDVYNLQVEESHTFYVVTHSNKLYLVHNCSEGGSK